MNGLHSNDYNDIYSKQACLHSNVLFHHSVSSLNTTHTAFVCYGHVMRIQEHYVGRSRAMK